VKLPLGPGSPDLRAGRYELVRYVFRPNDTIGHVVRVVAAMRGRFSSRFPYGVLSRLEIDWPPKPATVDALPPRTIRVRTPSVAGRLRPEVILSVASGKQSALSSCYGEGLRRDPTLSGTVYVKFVIDRTGAVSTAQPQTGIKDREVGACLARVFSGMSFPEPEGGIVTVTVPIELVPRS
jgi:hypothetical protein